MIPGRVSVSGKQKGGSVLYDRQVPFHWSFFFGSRSLVPVLGDRYLCSTETRATPLMKAACALDKLFWILVSCIVHGPSWIWTCVKLQRI